MQLALIITEAEYIVLLQSLRELIPLMGIIDELRVQGVQCYYKAPVICCRVFEDDFTALELVTAPKICLQTKHINICYHHFQEHVSNGCLETFPLTS